MTPDDLAALHARAFTTPAPWSAEDFAATLSGRAVRLLTRPGGFLVLRLVADEAEILTLAVDPRARRQGTGRALVGEALDMGRVAGATSVFLEVAADNAAAIRLYESAGFTRAGTRKGYYRAPDGTRIDAHVLRREV